MKRLTFNHNGVNCVDGRNGKLTSDNQARFWGVAIDRLAAYEDTGLEPDEINRILDAYGRGMTMRTESGQRLEAVKAIKTERLVELARAEQEGRLVVLPCKPGEEVWTGYDKYSLRRAFYMSYSAILKDMEDGYGIGYTREEAEKALESR